MGLAGPFFPRGVWVGSSAVLGQVSGRGSWLAWSELLALPFFKSGVRFGQGEGGKHLTERSSILALSMGNGGISKRKEAAWG